jgi:alkylation response protein AidB-like acyl-CoA dehydrogenase
MIDLSLTDEQSQLRETVGSFLERHCDTTVVRAAEPLGFEESLSKGVRELGLVDLAVAAQAGGAGGDLADLAIACELLGAHLAPVPLVEMACAARLLGKLIEQGKLAPDSKAKAGGLLSELTEGGEITTIALQPPGRPPREVHPVLRWVPAGAIADHVLYLDDEELCVARAIPKAQSAANLGFFPLADLDLLAEAEPEILASGSKIARLWEETLNAWRALSGSWLVGAGQRALEIARLYTTEREVFGIPIAAYQSPAHKMADLATALQGALLLTRKAAWAADHDPGSFSALAAMAVAFAGETAEQAATESLHFHGGYGFTLEYDIQLYLRRIKALSQLAGGINAGLARVAEALWGTAQDSTNR